MNRATRRAFVTLNSTSKASPSALARSSGQSTSMLLKAPTQTSPTIERVPPKFQNIKLRLIILSLLWLVVSGCSTTFVTSKWKDPALTQPLHFNKIVALAVHEDGTIRRVTEDEMARQIGSRAVPAYTIITDEDRKDVDRIKARLQAAGVDGAVAMKLLGKQSQTTYSAGAPAGGYQDVYSWSHVAAADIHRDWGFSHEDMPVNDPQTNTILLINTSIYSVNDAKMIWSAISHTETFTPENVRQDVSEIAEAVKAQLRNEKLIPSEQEN